MLCLVFADMNSTAGLGPVAAIGVGVTLVVLMTLLPALLACYFGQAALLLDDPAALDNPFYRLAPPWLTLPGPPPGCH